MCGIRRWNTTVRSVSIRLHVWRLRAMAHTKRNSEQANEKCRINIYFSFSFSKLNALRDSILLEHVLNTPSNNQYFVFFNSIVIAIILVYGLLLYFPLFHSPLIVSTLKVDSHCARVAMLVVYVFLSIWTTI